MQRHLEPYGPPDSVTGSIAGKQRCAGAMFAPVLANLPADDDGWFAHSERFEYFDRQLAQKYGPRIRMGKSETAGTIQCTPNEDRRYGKPVF
jgi:hypothetical protein